jgi:CubicO group peptidase (beta-lactamase class C family)
VTRIGLQHMPAGRAALRSRRGILASLVLAAAIPATDLNAQATTLRIGDPAAVDMSAEVLDGAVGLYREAVARDDLVGAVVLVARNGTVVLHEAVGSRNHEAGLPMEKNTMFRMASNTKPVVATGLAMLVENGKLSFDDPVRAYIPAFDNYRSGFIQVKHLLSHTSGFRINSLFLQPYVARSAEHPDAPNLRLEVARFGEVGAMVTPGTSYAYSNPGYNTVGALIEIASGRPLEVYLREQIYRPLGMSDTYHTEVAELLDGKLDRMGAVYYERENGMWTAGWKPGDPPQVPFVRASGGLISTAWDYAIFLQTFLNGGAYGNTRLLEPETVKTLTSRQTPAGEPSYGFGWSVADDGVYSHRGSDGTFAWVDPERGIIGMVLTQTPRGRNPVNRFIELVNLSIGDARPRT